MAGDADGQQEPLRPAAEAHTSTLQQAIAAAAREAKALQQRVSAKTFSELRQLANNGDPHAIKVLNRMRRAGQKRNLYQAELLYNQLPPSVRADPVAMTEFLEGKDFSHIIPKSKFGGNSGIPKSKGGEASNGFWENHAINQARGDATATQFEQATARVVNSAPMIGKATVSGAVVSGGLSAVFNGYSVYNGDKTVKEAVKDVAVDAAIGGVTAGVITAVGFAWPPLGMAIGVVQGGLLAKGLLWDTGAAQWAYGKAAGLLGDDGLEVELPCFPEVCLIVVDVDGRIMQVVVVAEPEAEPEREPVAAEVAAPVQQMAAAAEPKAVPAVAVVHRPAAAVPLSAAELRLKRLAYFGARSSGHGV